MAWEYGFGKLEDELIEAGKAYPPDFEKMKELLASGADINAISTKEEPDESILSIIILGYPETDDGDGRYLPELCSFFLANGFDVHRSDGAFGACCLQNLTWSSYDRYILEAAKVLLRAGADPTVEYDHETVLRWVATKVSAAGCVDEDHSAENLFEAMYRILEAASENRDFDSIEYFSAAEGRSLDRVEMYCEPGQQPIFSMKEKGFQHEHCFTGTLVLWCGGKALQIDRWTSIVIDPAVKQSEDRIKTDISNRFSDLIGSTLRKIDFEHEVIRKGISYSRAVIRLHFSNGRILRFSDNFGEVSSEKRAAFFDTI